MDPFFSTEKCVERLYKEYLEHKRLIVAVDFDDTIFDYHKKGYTYDTCIGTILDCQKLGFYIVIFTGTPPEKWDGIKEYCKRHGILVSAINKNPIDLPFGNHGKIYYNILLDDRSGLSQSNEILRETINKIQTNYEVESPARC